MGGGRRGAATSLAYGHPHPHCVWSTSNPPRGHRRVPERCRTAKRKQLGAGGRERPRQRGLAAGGKEGEVQGTLGARAEGKEEGVEWGGEWGTQGDRDPGVGGGRGREERWGEGGGGGAAAGLRARELQTGWLRPQPELPPALRSRRSASAREDVPAEAAADGGATRGGLPSTLGRLRLRAPGDP